MTEKHFSEDKLDLLIRTSLSEEEAPPPAVQAALIAKIRDENKPEWNMPWWLLAAIGGMQTAAFVAGASLILPDFLFSYLVMPAGAGLMLSAAILSVLAHKKSTRKEGEYVCGQHPG